MRRFVATFRAAVRRTPQVVSAHGAASAPDPSPRPATTPQEAGAWEAGYGGRIYRPRLHGPRADLILITRLGPGAMRALVQSPLAPAQAEPSRRRETPFERALLRE